MKIITQGIKIVGLAALIGTGTALGGSQSGPTSLQATYLLASVNGKEVPAISWVTEKPGERCEYLTSSGALLLDLVGRSGGFAMERINCLSANGTRTSQVNDFHMFTGSYKILGKQIIIHDEVSADQGVLDGNTMTITVAGVGIFDGQITEYVFELAR